ncbi:XdhC family protein [Isoptericola jiangsuensis]|uniref:XdhC family protein n=1 Tax=Isoptericola jiangsuensis TaxID=548579 RepID=UPI003AAE3D11
MLQMALDLLPLLRSGVPVAAVTITQVGSSAPRGVGAAMAVTGDGAVIGSISGGCVEGEAVVLGRLAAATGEARTARFGFDDATAHAAGLACGGQIDVVAHRLDPDDAVTVRALEDVAADRATAVGVVTSGPHAGRVVPAPAAAPGDPTDRSVLLPAAHDGADLLVLRYAPRPRLILLGAGEHAAALCRLGAAAGYAVTVCDTWETLVTAARFPAADRLVVALPHEYLASLDGADTDARTAVCVLTHDERLDVPAIRTALSMPVGFVGALGARSTVAHRATLLRAAGVGEVDLARLHSPLGLDLRGTTPEETALSVLAEIVASRHGGSGVPLRETSGRIHREVGTTTRPTGSTSSTSSTTGTSTRTGTTCTRGARP